MSRFWTMPLIYAAMAGFAFTALAPTSPGWRIADTLFYGAVMYALGWALSQRSSRGGE